MIGRPSSPVPDGKEEHGQEMNVLHGNWSAARELCLWAEDSRLPSKASVLPARLAELAPVCRWAASVCTGAHSR